MCGIAGTFNLPEFGEQNVAAMIDSIRYRGPDEAGTVKMGPATLGHARLAVVDPENGTQPMSNEDGTVWVVFNGEIYNFVELREELMAGGHQFKSRCDTEVLVHLWEEEGPAMLGRLIGMFAFFIWDSRVGKGMLARDRQGIKPCYIMERGGGFAFASEIKSLLSLPGVEARIDDVGLNMVHSFNYCLPPRTCYEGIRHMDPGTYWLLDADGGRTVHRYWNWSVGQDPIPFDAEAFAETLDDAIRLQMRFDVLGCLFLSGGVDSSIIAAHLKKHWNETELRAFGLDCTLPGYGEFDFSQQAAEALGISVKPMKYNENIVTEEIEAFLHHADQPHGDFSFMLIRRLCQAAHQAGVIVAFNGDGPDEILSGFNHNQAFLSAHPGSNFDVDAYFKNICYFAPEQRKAVLTPEFAEQLPNPVDHFREILEPYQDFAPIDQIAAYETGVLAPGNNLIKTDRMGAALSIEGRSPFLDHRVSELLARVPAQERLAHGATKYVLKAYGTRHFEQDFMFRKKSMPTLPIGEWIKGPLQSWARETLSTLDPARYHVNAALDLLEQHVSGSANHTRELRTLLTTAKWMTSL